MSVAAKTRRFPFIFNKIPCGSSAAVVAIGCGNNRRRLLSIEFFFPLDSICETSLWSWDEFNLPPLDAAASHVSQQLDINTNTANCTTKHHTMILKVCLKQMCHPLRAEWRSLHPQPCTASIALSWRLSGGTPEADCTLIGGTSAMLPTHSFSNHLKSLYKSVQLILWGGSWLTVSMCFLFNLCGWVLILNCLRPRHEFCAHRLG